MRSRMLIWCSFWIRISHLHSFGSQVKRSLQLYYSSSFTSHRLFACPSIWWFVYAAWLRSFNLFIIIIVSNGRLLIRFVSTPPPLPPVGLILRPVYVCLCASLDLTYSLVENRMTDSYVNNRKMSAAWKWQFFFLAAPRLWLVRNGYFCHESVSHILNADHVF